jgi:ATP-dependent Clp protease ATP-binding subunit ClpA
VAGASIAARRQGILRGIRRGRSWDGGAECCPSWSRRDRDQRRRRWCIANVRRDKESAIDAQDFERAAHLRYWEKQLLAQKGEREKQWKSGDLDVVAEVDDEQIAEVLANWTGIPVFKLTEEETTPQSAPAL